MALRISCMLPDGRLVAFGIEANTLVGTMKAIVAAETGIDAAKIELVRQGRPLADSSTASDYGISNNDLIEVRITAPRAAGRQETLADIPRHLYSQPRMLLEWIKCHPGALQQLITQNPRMAEAVLTDNVDFMMAIMNEQERQRKAQEAQRRAADAALNADPLDPAAQAKIAEAIRLKNVQENMEKAMEYNPESFGTVIMLYVPMTVNKHKLKAFVDSGAQSTIMSVECAQRCGIMRLVDKRFAGYAKGVGTAKIVGRVHNVFVQVGKESFTCSFTILESQGMDFLFGLDQLKRHQCLIDLKDNCLRIGNEAIPFLSEKDLPASAHEQSVPPTDEGKKSSTSSAPVPSTPSSAPTLPTPKPSSESSSSASGMPISANRPSAALPNEATVLTLMGLGFPREACIQALRACNGNAEMAASYLFGMG